MREKEYYVRFPSFLIFPFIIVFILLECEAYPNVCLSFIFLSACLFTLSKSCCRFWNILFLLAGVTCNKRDQVSVRDLEDQAELTKYLHLASKGKLKTSHGARFGSLLKLLTQIHFFEGLWESCFYPHLIPSSRFYLTFFGSLSALDLTFFHFLPSQTFLSGILCYFFPLSSLISSFLYLSCFLSFSFSLALRVFLLFQRL